MEKITLLLAFLTVASALPRQDRIIGGSTTSIETYPYSAALLMPIGHVILTYGIICGGSIINNRSVLTAAHCCLGKEINVPDYLVRVGSVSVSSGGSIHNATLCMIHPQYNAPTLDNDIALLRVSTAFQFGSRVQPAPIIGQNAVFPDNTLVWAIGWGSVTSVWVTLPEDLQHVQIRTVPKEICQQYFGKSRITAAMICAAGDVTTLRGSCKGDSGSPIVLNNVVVGVTSFGLENCGFPFSPAVYTRVAHFTNWITSNA